MWCKKLSNFLTMDKCCCGVPLKSAVYVAGVLLLIYCAYMETGTLQVVFSNNNGIFKPLTAVGSGVAIVGHNMWEEGDLDTVAGYTYFVRALFIAWAVINGLLIISTLLMIVGTVKSLPILIIQWLVIAAAITIGNMVDIIFAIIYLESNTNGNIFDSNSYVQLVHCFIESVAIAFAFLVVRSYYHWLTILPSEPTSFKALEKLVSQHEED